MRKTNVILISILVLVFSVQCNSQSTPFTSLPPNPTSTSGVSPLPTNTPQSASPSQSTNPACELWNVARPQLGTTVCVQGTVAKASNIGNDFIMEFDNSGNSIYGRAHNYFYPGIDGNCVRMTGEVKKDESGRLYLQVDLPGQVEPCNQ